MSASGINVTIGGGVEVHRARRLYALCISGALAVAALVVTSANAQALQGPTPEHRSTTSATPPGSAASLDSISSLDAFSPPTNPNPASPALFVTSGQHQSDPFLFLSGGQYYLATSGGTDGGPSVNVPVASATTFDQWSTVTDALPVLPRWAVSGFTWAPDIHQFGSTFVLYFTTVLRGSTPPIECIGDATGSAPDGPFTPVSTPFICQTNQGGSIDPRVFTDGDGTNWMLWKSDQNIGGATTPTKMWSQRLTANGLGLTGRPTDIMEPDEAWQGTIVEAPDMVKVNGIYWVFYSGNWFNQPEYGIGAARCTGPAGPCADTSPLPLVGTNRQGAGPGEASVFKDSAGVWMLYSPWRSLAPKPDYPPRPVALVRVGFNPTGAYLAAGGPPPSLDPLWAISPWSAP